MGWDHETKQGLRWKLAFQGQCAPMSVRGPFESFILEFGGHPLGNTPILETPRVDKGPRMFLSPPSTL